MLRPSAFILRRERVAVNRLGNRRANVLAVSICQLHPVDAARSSGQLFSEVRAAERPCAKYQQ
jgi:hypothetical protein